MPTTPDSPLEPLFDEALEFLTAWFGPIGPWPIAAIESAPPPGRRAVVIATVVESERAARAFFVEYSARGWNLYFHPNVPVPTIRTTASKEQIVSTLGLHVDVDLPHPPAPFSEPTSENLERIRRRVAALDPPPTFVIFTGGGYQALWRFASPLANPEFQDRVEEANRLIKECALGGDHCQNVNRLLRLPGTINVPNAAKRARGRTPALARLFFFDPARTWSFLDPVPALPPDFSEPSAPRADLDEDATVAFARTVDELPPALRRLITTGDASRWNGDRSRLVLSVALRLVRFGWSDEEVSAVLLDPRYLVSAHARSQGDPARAAARALAWAREKVAADWVRDPRTFVIRAASQENIRRALASIGASFSFDTFALRAYVNGYGPSRVVDDDSMIDLRLTIDQRYGFLPDERLFHDVTRHLCRRGDFHPVRRYLDSLVHDGTARLGRVAPADLARLGAADAAAFDLADLGAPSWLTRYGGVEDSPYVRAVGRLILVAAVRRARHPGARFDEMMVFINPRQGTFKSSALQVLARRDEWFTDDLPLGAVVASGKRAIELLAGRWIVEASDLAGMRRADVEDLKNFLSRRFDADRLAYDEYRTELARSCVFFGTTNSEVFLKDDENRRFWPVRVDRFDVEALERDADQLWAEAAAVEATGESIRLHPAFWDIAAEHQAAARSEEPWVEILADAFKAPDGSPIDGKIVNSDAWKIVNKPAYLRTQEDNRRLGEAMRANGFERTRARADGAVRIVYARGTLTARAAMIYVHRDEVSGELIVTNDYERVRAYHRPAASAPLLDPETGRVIAPDQPEVLF